ncbi:hypothetical protein BC835DRAFT_111585 [Cytidiella melzeri]|nr:hypothetical protein BC835DRAFT_111585 [Cytidiella melzeri]
MPNVGRRTVSCIMSTAQHYYNPSAGDCASITGDTPQYTRIDYENEIRRLRAVNAVLFQESNELKGRVIYFEAMTAGWNEQLTAKEGEVYELKAKIDNFMVTWFDTTSQLEAAHSELNKIRNENIYLQQAIAKTSRASSNAVQAERTRQREVIGFKARLQQVSAKCEGLFGQAQKESVARQVVEKELLEEREKGKELREAAKSVEAALELMKAEKEELVVALELVRIQNDDLNTELEHTTERMEGFYSELLVADSCECRRDPRVPMYAFPWERKTLDAEPEQDEIDTDGDYYDEDLVQPPQCARIPPQFLHEENGLLIRDYAYSPANAVGCLLPSASSHDSLFGDEE